MTYTKEELLDKVNPKPKKWRRGALFGTTGLALCVLLYPSVNRFVSSEVQRWKTGIWDVQAYSQAYTAAKQEMATNPCTIVAPYGTPVAYEQIIGLSAKDDATNGVRAAINERNGLSLPQGAKIFATPTYMAGQKIEIPRSMTKPYMQCLEDSSRELLQ